MRAAGSRRRSPLAIFFVVCGVLIAALFAFALRDLAQDGDRPPSFRTNDLTSAITSAAMLGIVGFAYLKVTPPRSGLAAPPADEPGDAAAEPSRRVLGEPRPARTPPGRRRRRRK